MILLQDLYEYIKSGETKTQNLGLEIEHFVVDNNGKPITFEEVTSLIEQVGRESHAELAVVDGHIVGYYNGRYSISLEPACQFEISINPYSNLSEIEEVYQDFLSVWEPIFRERGFHIVTKGNLPIVEESLIDPDDIPLSPKKRYQYMDAYFRNSGKYGKYMMRASASTQVSLDYHSESDLVRKLNVLQKISPILMMMMESKTFEDTTLKEAPQKPHLLRIQEWDDLDPARTGFYPGSPEPDFGYSKIAQVVYHTPLILLTDEGETTYVGSQCAEDLVASGIINEDQLSKERRKSLIEHFMSMGFFHIRIKKYLEVRVADSVPIRKALVYTALLKGIVYSEENLAILEEELEQVRGLAEIQAAVEAIEKDGFEAVIYHGRTTSEWASYLVQLAWEGLPEQERMYLYHV